jgi:hypothetical protein
LLTNPKNYVRHEYVPEQEAMTYLPVGQEDWGEKTPNIKKHADPRADDTHPHRRFGAPDVDVVTVGRRRRRLRTNKVPGYNVENSQRDNGKMLRKYSYQSVSSIATYMAPSTKMIWNQEYWQGVR